MGEVLEDALAGTDYQGNDVLVTAIVPAPVAGRPGEFRENES